MRGVGIFLAAVLSAACAGESVDRASSEAPPAQEAVATFAGGCFWCMEGPFEKLEGVHAVVSGYAGGKEKNPAYKEVASGRTGHREAVQVHYDPKKIGFDRLLDTFWMSFDPTDAGGQFADRGPQYASGIFYHSEGQKVLAQASKKKLGASKRFANPIVTPIEPFSTFYPAEDYHQNYYRKNPIRYKVYTRGSGRAEFLKRIWKK